MSSGRMRLEEGFKEPGGMAFARRCSGEAGAFTLSGADVWLPFEDLFEHVLLAGATGSGKSESALALLYGVARDTDWAVPMLDAKGDRASAEAYVALMRSLGRSPAVFPNEHFDIWRGDADAIIEKVLAAIDYADKGAATYYRDMAEVVIQLACRFEEGPPRSSGELLFRLEERRLLEEYSSGVVKALGREKIDGTRARYEALFGRIGNRLDGRRSWEDVDCWYLLLDSLSSPRAAGSMARMLFADFAHYFSTKRKAKEKGVLLGADEFSAVSSMADIGNVMRQARSFRAALAVITQTISALGDEQQLEDILGNVGIAVVHRMPSPEELTRRAGWKKAVALSHRYEGGRYLEEGHSQEERVPKVDPDVVRKLPTGMAVMIRRGLYVKAMVHMAPDVELDELPAVEPVGPPVMPVVERKKPNPGLTDEIFPEPEGDESGSGGVLGA